jgi:arylsulfatase A-like enzyme
MSGQHRLPDGKRVAYEESIRVPLVVRGPGFPRGAVRSAPVANIDLAPTVAALAAARPGLREDGCSLLPLAKSASARWRRDLLFESFAVKDLRGEGDILKTTLPRYAAVRSGQYMYIEYANGERELYDLEADPDELVNRASDPALATVRGDLVRRLSRLRTTSGAHCTATRGG